MAKLQAPGVSPGKMLFLRSSPVGAKDPTESVAPMSGCECKPGRAQPSRKTVLTLERAEIPGLAPGATYCRRSAASIGIQNAFLSNRTGGFGELLVIIPPRWVPFFAGDQLHLLTAPEIKKLGVE